MILKPSNLYRSLHPLLGKADQLVEPRSDKKGPRMGVTFIASHYDYLFKKKRNPPFHFNAGVFLTKPGRVLYKL